MKSFLKIYYFAIILLLFLGINVLAKIGIFVEFDSAPMWQKILPSAYLIIPISIYALLTCKSVTSYKCECHLLFLFLFMLFSLYIKGSAGYIGVINCNVFPVALSIVTCFYLSTKSLSRCKVLYKIVIVFYLIECMLSVFERIFEINIFPFLGSGTASILSYSSFMDGFRSTALQNHPLQNSLCVSILMAFILCSNIKIKKKLSLFFLGYLAILCFNTRGSIVLWGVFFIIYLLFNLKKYKGNSRLTLIFVTVVGVLAMIYLILNYGLADRLIKNGLLDESSAGQRLQLFDVFNFLSWNDWLFGISSIKQQRVLDFVNVGIIENPWLVIAFSHGIIVLTMMIFLYFRLFKRLFKEYKLFDKLFICFTFLIIASTNNSLVTPGAYLPLFLLCSYLFSPKYKNI